ncbi:LexA family transcriptional regulator [Marinomonas sp. RSW2]|uniref:LexA family transcriptional regulator n=1 Tax=Marinomonas maritima TaxID=2940935 RepID=A0ABT5WGH9_9GAMM|nr:LexA family transcriptional regulator [Marinomonas maritima]MDE8603927.1 LexA family transcriptional regulator [Marinomonas maritima]
MDIGERILRKRTEMKLTVRGLAKLVEASPATVSQWENNRTLPNGKNLNNLAKIFKTTPTWILNGKDYTANIPLSSNVAEAPAQYNTKSLPVLSQVQAGGWMEALDYRSLGNDIEWEDAPSRASDNSFWLRVVGDSMTSPVGISIPEGMLILVDPDIAPENGKLVVVKLDGTDEATFKKLAIDAGMKFLKPLNPTYPTIPINGNCQILGVVIEAKFKL